MLNSIVCALNGFTCSLNDDRGDRKRKFEKGAPWDANEPALRSWIEGHDEMQDWMRDFEAQETKPPLCKRCTKKIGAAYRRVKKTRRASAPASLPVPTPPPIDVESGIDVVRIVRYLYGNSKIQEYQMHPAEDGLPHRRP